MPTLKLKLVACMISGALISAAGAPAAMYLQYADPSSAFNLSYSVSALAMAPFNAWPVLFVTFPVVVWLIDGAAASVDLVALAHTLDELADAVRRSSS